MVQPGTGDVLAIAQSRPMGRDTQEGRDLPQLRRRQQVRRLQRLPGRLDVQDVRAGGRARAGPARLDQRSTHRRRCTSRRTSSPTATGPTRRRRSGSRTTPPSDGNFDMYHGHPALGEHLLRPARAARPGCASRTRWPRPMGVDARPTRASERVPVLHPRRRRRQPAGDGRGLRDRSPPAACTATPSPVTEILNSDGQGLQELQPQLPAGDGAGHRRHGQRHPARRDGAGWVRPGARASTSRRPARPAPSSNNKAVWFVGYTPALATAAMIAGANQHGHADHAERPDRRRRATSTWRPARRWPGRCGPWRCGHPGRLPDEDFIAGRDEQFDAPRSQRRDPRRRPACRRAGPPSGWPAPASTSASATASPPASGEGSGGARRPDGGGGTRAARRSRRPGGGAERSGSGTELRGVPRPRPRHRRRGP